jgi:hypothetical protein
MDSQMEDNGYVDRQIEDKWTNRRKINGQTDRFADKWKLDGQKGKEATVN